MLFLEAGIFSANLETATPQKSVFFLVLIQARVKREYLEFNRDLVTLGYCKGANARQGQRKIRKISLPFQETHFLGRCKNLKIY